MGKTFNINTEIVDTILKSYQDFLKIEIPRDKFTDRILELIDELDTEKFCEILEQSFHASLKKEEGLHHNFSLILSPPENKFNDLLEPYTQKHFVGYFDDVSSFENPISIEVLPKIAPAFESTNKKLRVWFNDENQTEIWGFASRFFDYFGLEIKSFSPGQLLIHIKAQDFPHKRYLLTLSDSKRVVSNFSLVELLFDKSDIDKVRNVSDRENYIRFGHRQQKRHWFLIDIINKVMNHKHGGTLLFIPQQISEEIFNESIKSMSYQPKGRYEYTERKLIKEENEIVFSDKTGTFNKSLPWSFGKDADFIAQITAVDGATILNKDFGVLAFGAKTKEKSKSKKTKDNFTNVWIKEPFENFNEHEEKLSELGGMRHQSTAQFIFDQREKDVFAIVASEDGKVSIMYWDKVRKMVTVIRHIEYLFYGMNI